MEYFPQCVQGPAFDPCHIKRKCKAPGTVGKTKMAGHRLGEIHVIHVFYR